MREQAIERFRRAFDRSPEFIVRSPGRVNLIGDHTDYNDGFVFPMALEHAVWMAVGGRDDGEIGLDSAEGGAATLDLAQLTPRRDWTDYVAGTLLSLPLETVGFDAAVVSDLPTGAGLSSSAALELGVQGPHMSCRARPGIPSLPPWRDSGPRTTSSGFRAESWTN